MPEGRLLGTIGGAAVLGLLGLLMQGLFGLVFGAIVGGVLGNRYLVVGGRQ